MEHVPSSQPHPAKKPPSMEEMRDHIEQLESKVHELEEKAKGGEEGVIAKELNHYEEKHPNAARNVTAIALGLIGAKIGALAGGAVGITMALREVNRRVAAGEETTKTVSSAEQAAPKIATSGLTGKLAKMMGEEGSLDVMSDVLVRETTDFKNSKTIRGKVIGAVLAGVGAAAIGYARGNRIEHAGDIVSHPFASAGKLMFGEPVKRNLPSSKESPSTKIEQVSEHTLTQPSPETQI